MAKIQQHIVFGLLALCLISASQCSFLTSRNLMDTPGCNADDMNLVRALQPGHDNGSFPKIGADCARGAAGLFSFDNSNMEQCLVDNTEMSAGCSQCFRIEGRYGYDNCKMACIANWCSEACLTCMDPAHAQVNTCAGFDDYPKASSC